MGQFFLQRVMSAWNVWPGMVVEEDTIMAFKMFLDRHMDMELTEEKRSCAGR